MTIGIMTIVQFAKMLNYGFKLKKKKEIKREDFHF